MLAEDFVEFTNGYLVAADGSGHLEGGALGGF